MRGRWFYGTAIKKVVEQDWSFAALARMGRATFNRPYRDVG